MENSLLERFVQSFQKAIRSEMEAMRTRLGPFEIPLTRGRPAESAQEAGPSDLFSYAFDLPKPSDKLVPDTECVLRAAGEEWTVTLVQVRAGAVQLTSTAAISLSDPVPVLIIYPWFLYEKLLLALEDLERNPDAYWLDRAWALFGKRTPQRHARPPQLSHGTLNPSQQRAVGRPSGRSNFSRLIPVYCGQVSVLHLTPGRRANAYLRPPGLHRAAHASIRGHR